MDSLTQEIVSEINQSIDNKIDKLEVLRGKLLAPFGNENPVKKSKPVEPALPKLQLASGNNGAGNPALKGKSKYKHVYVNKCSKKNPWKTQVFRDGKQKSLGSFPTQEAAAQSVADFLKVPVGSLLKKEESRWIGGRDLNIGCETESNPSEF